MIGIFTCCILIYLGFRHISSIAAAISWLMGLAKPLITGVILSLIFNVPMSFFERFLRKKIKLSRGARALSIVLAMVLVFGIFVGVMVLVVPELAEALKLMIQIAGNGLDQLAQLETNTSLMPNPVGQYLSKLDIDWLGLKNQMEEWFRSQRGNFVNHAVGAAGSLAGGLVTFFIGLVEVGNE